MPETIRPERAGDIGMLIPARRAKRNARNPPMWEELPVVGRLRRVPPGPGRGTEPAPAGAVDGAATIITAVDRVRRHAGG
jgi:hypothetical protein